MGNLKPVQKAISSGPVFYFAPLPRIIRTFRNFVRNSDKRCKLQRVIEFAFDLSNRYQIAISPILTNSRCLYYIVSMSEFRFESAFEMADAREIRTKGR